MLIRVSATVKIIVLLFILIYKGIVSFLLDWAVTVSGSFFVINRQLFILTQTFP